MKYFTAILLSAFLACSLSAQSSSKRDILPAQRKAELKENFQKSLVKNDFGDIAIPVPKPDIDSSYEFEWMFGHPYHFLQFFDSDINGELLRKLTSDESYLQKASFKGNRAMSTIECYLKEWRLRLKKGSFKPSEIKRRLDEGQPMFAYLSLRSGELKETAARLRERSKSASAKDWQKALDKYGIRTSFSHVMLPKNHIHYQYIIDKFAIKALPTNVLLDKNRRIIFSNLDGNALAKKMEELTNINMDN